MTADSTEIVMCMACGHEMVAKAVAVTIVEDVINDVTDTVYALAYPYHEGDFRKGTVCALSMKLVDPSLREKYK